MAKDKGIANYERLIQEKEAVQDAIRNRGGNAAMYGGDTARTITNQGRLTELNKELKKAVEDGSEDAWKKLQNYRSGLTANQNKVATLEQSITERTATWNLQERQLLVEKQKQKNQLSKLNRAYSEQIKRIDEEEKAEKLKAEQTKRITELEKKRADLLANQNQPAMTLKAAQENL